MTQVDPAKLRMVLAAAAYYDTSYPPWVNPNDPYIDTITPATGVVSVLTSIVVAGHNFAADAVVEANGAALTTTAKTPTSLTGAYTPATVGAKNITVRNVALAEESNSKLFTVTATLLREGDEEEEPPTDDNESQADDSPDDEES